MKTRKQCKICIKMKWFPVKPKKKEKQDKDPLVYDTCLTCRNLLTQIKHKQENLEKKGNVRVIPKEEVFGH